ncbi:MAG: NF038122 family metalloprotease [Acidobacteria bacterium]|nr:NF038122 family metalloprotease [Acidobacteriota bacterium]
MRNKRLVKIASVSILLFAVTMILPWILKARFSSTLAATYKRDGLRSAGETQKPGIKFGTSYQHDTSEPLRDMAQQSVKASKAKITRGTDSVAILVSGISPDTQGAVGATQRVKLGNDRYQIFDNRTGASVMDSSDISTIWAGFGGSCATGGTGDTVVLYDKVADRWVISQFASATSGKAATEQCFAVSTTSDATGSYYRYAFHLGPNFIDSPHLSIRPDGYLMGDSVYNESGTERLGSQFFLFDRKAMLAGAAATFTSPGLDTGVGETYSISASGVRVRSASSQLAVSTLTINLTYDPDATFTTAGLSASDIIAMKAANSFAAQQFTNNYVDPINVNIKVTAVPGTGTLGGSSTSLTVTTFANMVAKTVADATTADDATATGSGGSISSTLVDPVGGAHNYLVSFAQAKALGISPDDAVTIDGTYTFGGGFSYTYDPLNRAVAGKFDYIGVSMHEFSEIMGRIGVMGGDLGVGSPSYMQFDLFHYTGAGARGLNNGAGRSFSIDNGTTLLKAFNDGATFGGDLQDWASGTNDSFNAFSGSGVRNDLTPVDLRNMDVIGYNFVPSCTLVTCPANITQPNDPNQCGAVVSYPVPTTSGTCDAVTCSPASGAFFSVGTTTVTCTPAAGPSCSFTVTVNDTQSPMIACPANIIRSTDPGLCSAIVNPGTPTATDNCPGVTVTGARSDALALTDPYPKGITTITWKATDASGNMATCPQTITVNDTEKPKILCPADVTVVTPKPGDPSTTVSFPAPMVTDNCPGATVTCVPPSGSSFPLGTTLVTCTASDTSGNMAECSFTVTVWDVCIKDDQNGDFLLFNSFTGDYLFTRCGADRFTMMGRGEISRVGCVVTLHDDTRVNASYDRCPIAPRNTGNAIIKRLQPDTTFVLKDRNILNNSPSCPTP